MIHDCASRWGRRNGSATTHLPAVALEVLGRSGQARRSGPGWGPPGCLGHTDKLAAQGERRRHRHDRLWLGHENITTTQIRQNEPPRAIPDRNQQPGGRPPAASGHRRMPHRKRNLVWRTGSCKAVSGGQYSDRRMRIDERDFTAEPCRDGGGDDSAAIGVFRVCGRGSSHRRLRGLIVKCVDCSRDPESGLRAGRRVTPSSRRLACEEPCWC